MLLAKKQHPHPFLDGLNTTLATYQRLECRDPSGHFRRDLSIATSDELIWQHAQIRTSMSSPTAESRRPVKVTLDMNDRTVACNVRERLQKQHGDCLIRYAQSFECSGKRQLCYATAKLPQTADPVPSRLVHIARAPTHDLSTAGSTAQHCSNVITLYF